MRPEWISDQPFHDLLPYVRMLGEQTVLLCNPPGLSPRGISRVHATGDAAQHRQLVDRTAAPG